MIVQSLVVREVCGSLVVREVPVDIDVVEHGLLALNRVQELRIRKSDGE